jgi:hypothetical protein
VSSALYCTAIAAYCPDSALTLLSLSPTAGYTVGAVIIYTGDTRCFDPPTARIVAHGTLLKGGGTWLRAQLEPHTRCVLLEIDLHPNADPNAHITLWQQLSLSTAVRDTTPNVDATLPALG